MSETSSPSFSTRLTALKQRLMDFSRTRKARRGGVTLVSLFLLFGLVGYLWLPGFIHKQMEQALSEVLERPVTVGKVEVQPYILAVTVRDLRIGEKQPAVVAAAEAADAAPKADAPDAPKDVAPKDETPKDETPKDETPKDETPKDEAPKDEAPKDEALAGFSSLTINLSSASLWRWALVLDALRLEQPYAHLRRAADGSTNISDLVTKFASKEDEPEIPVPPFAINNLQVVGGSFTLDDVPTNGRHEISGLELALPRLASFPGEVDRETMPRFAAVLDGAPINVDGEMRPFTDSPDGALNLRIQGLDLARLARFSPVPLPLTLQAGTLDTDLKLDFLVGDTQQLGVQGQVAFKGFQLGREDASLGLESLVLQVQSEDVLGKPIHLQQIQLAGLSAKRKDDEKPLLQLGRLGLDQVTLNTAQQLLTVGQVSLDAPQVALTRLADGRLNAEALVAALQAPGKTKAPAQAKKPVEKKAVPEGEAATEPKVAKSAPWNWVVQGVKLQGGALGFVDRSVAKAVPLRVHELAVSLGQVDSRAPGPVALGVDARINDKGSLHVQGPLDVLAPAGELDVKVEGMDLVPLQGWIPHHFNLVLTKGELGVNGQVKFGGQPLVVSYQGSGGIAQLSLMDGSADRALLRWESLALNGVEFQSEPFRLKLDDVSLQRFFARLLVTPDGELQLDRLLRGDKPKAVAAQVPEAPVEPMVSASDVQATTVTPGAREGEQSAPVARKSEPLPVALGRFTLDGGTVIFNDQFIKPNYTANLSQLKGSVGPLEAGKRGKLLIQGKVDKTAPINITGELEPFSQELFLDVKAQARGIDMPAFSPYSGRYLGYNIKKGKLSVDVHYQVEKGMLQATNRIFLDQLTMGDKVESPDALSVPINLALALLKNSKGEIDIELPVSGSINDPQFSIGGIVFKAIMNLLLKAVTSPFTLLGSMFGGGEELSYVEFASGAMAISPETEQRLQQLSKALVDRPALTLEVTGHADPAQDTEGYRKVLLERQVKSRKVAADVARGKAATRLGDVQLTAEEYEKYLTQVYKDAKFDKPRNMIGLTKGLPVPDMEKLLLDHMQVSENDYRNLARLRAQGVRDWLVNTGNVPQERVFVLEPQVGGGEEPGNRAVFSLR